MHFRLMISHGWVEFSFLHDVSLHSLTLVQMCGCTQVRLATLQAIAECSTHTDGLNNTVDWRRAREQSV